jgi:iron complex outermembrane receptor protein
VDIPQVTVEGRQPKSGRRAAGRGTASRTVPAPAPAPTAPPTTTTASPSNPAFSPSTLTGAQVQANTSQSFGNLLFTMPGATSAGLSTQSARPVLRGLTDAKVRVQENGVGTVDVSDIAQDHGVPIDPLAIQRMQILRGPAALRFGGQAVGGIVDVTNNRIPTSAPIGGIGAEMRSGFSTVDNGWESGLLLDAGAGNAAVHADIYGRGAQDYRVPSYPYLVPPTPAPAFNGRQPNSSNSAAGASVGGSYLFDGGYAGLSISRFTSDYYVPGIATSENGQHNDLQQTKIQGKGEYRPDNVAIAAVRYWTGYSEYRHDEVDLIDDRFQAVGATFKNRQTEGKLEIETQPLATPFGALTSIFGTQGAYQQLDTSGQAILLPARTGTVAGYFFEEMKHTDTLRTQLAGRIESVNVSGTAFSFPSSFLPPPDDPMSGASTSSYLPVSISFGIIKDLPSDLAASLTLQRVQRAPRVLELFASGPDDSEKTFKIGNPDLTIETAKTIEVGLKRTRGDVRFDANLYYTSYDKFIYGASTGNFCGPEFATCGATGDYIQVNYAQRNAVFRGGEFSAQWDVGALSNGTFGVDGQFDFVRATFADGTNVPRIPPMRAGAGVYWRNDDWYTRLGYLHAFTQNDFDAFDTPTAGYDLLKFQLEHRQLWRDSPWGPVELTTGLIGDNLLNADIRNSVQFHKDEILQPGRTFKFFMNVKYGVDKPANAPIGLARVDSERSFFKVPPLTGWSWAGPYVGANIGYGWGSAASDAAFLDPTQTPIDGGYPSARLDNINVGGQAGYNWTAGRVVAGIEGDFDVVNQKGHMSIACPGSVCNAALAPLDATTTVGLDYRFGWVASLRGRIGTTLTPTTLAYVTAGVPFAQIKTSGTVASYDNAGNAVGAAFSEDTYRAGWAVGAGLEARLFGNWTGKVEYLHMDFGSVRATPDPSPNTAVALDTHTRVKSDAVRVGVNYKFNTGLAN